MQQRFLVVWSMDVYAETAKDAAQTAWDLLGEPNSTANYFEVYDQDGIKTNIDLGE